MYFRRLAYLGSVLVCMVVAPTTAFAASSLSITGARIGPEGGSVIVAVQYSCDTTGYASINVQVVQATGNRLARADGNVNNVSNPEVIVCDGTTHTAQVSAYNYGAIAFKKGKASATAQLYQDGYPTISAGPQEVSLK